MEAELIEPVRRPLRNALELAGMQYLSWFLCTISWRAVSQANVMVSIVTDTSLATLSFFVLRKIAKNTDDSALIPWFGYTVGGVLGTITGIYVSLWWLGK